MPQGYLQGPRLFNIHVFDLPEVPSKGELEMFADDTEHYVIGNTVVENSVIIEDVLHEVNEWCKQNCLTIHPDKTEVMIISRGPITRSSETYQVKRSHSKIYFGIRTFRNDGGQQTQME